MARIIHPILLEIDRITIDIDRIEQKNEQKNRYRLVTENEKQQIEEIENILIYLNTRNAFSTHLTTL